MKDNVTRQCPQATTSEEKGEPKQIRTEVPLLTSLTPYRWAKQAHKHTQESASTVKHVHSPIDTRLGSLAAEVPTCPVPDPASDVTS